MTPCCAGGDVFPGICPAFCHRGSRRRPRQARAGPRWLLASLGLGWTGPVGPKARVQGISFGPSRLWGGLALGYRPWVFSRSFAQCGGESAAARRRARRGDLACGGGKKQPASPSGRGRKVSYDISIIRGDDRWWCTRYGWRKWPRRSPLSARVATGRLLSWAVLLSHGRRPTGLWQHPVLEGTHACPDGLMSPWAHWPASMCC